MAIFHCYVSSPGWDSIGQCVVHCFADQADTSWSFFKAFQQQTDIQIEIPRRWIDIPAAIGDVLLHHGMNSPECSAILVISVPFYRFYHHWQSLLIVHHLPHHFFSRLASGETAHEKEAFLKGKNMLKDGESWCRTTLAFKGFAVSFMGKYLQNLILISVFTHTYRIIESYRKIYKRRYIDMHTYIYIYNHIPIYIYTYIHIYIYTYT